MDGGGGEPDGSSDDAGDGSSGEGGVRQAATPEDLFRAVCGWEFRCCTRGELDYRLGPFTTDVEACVERFSFELRESNSSSNPFPSGAGADALGHIAYRVDLGRVEVNEEGVAACIESWEERDCNDSTDVGATCEGPTPVSSRPCSFRNLFKPALDQGDVCDAFFTESSFGNDIECKPGTTCVAAGSSDNPSRQDVCVKRRVEGEFCTRNGECDFDLYCSDEGTCEEKSDIGEDCSFREPDDPATSRPDVACKEGLSCNPVDLKCVSNCSEGASCTGDAQCPEGLSCIQVELESGASVRLCQEPMEDGPCDSHEDCPAGQYCESEVPRTCKDRAGADEACAPLGAACRQGLYCDETCQPLLDVGQPCTSSAQCDAEKAEAGCIHDPADERRECASERLGLGAVCLSCRDCASGICEAVEPESGRECTEGVGAGQSCDAARADPELPTCALDHACLGGTCVVRLDPGEECLDPETGNPSSALCKGGSCDSVWDQRVCTDAPVPESLGGTGVTCGGR